MPNRTDGSSEWRSEGLISGRLASEGLATLKKRNEKKRKVDMEKEKRESKNPIDQARKLKIKSK